MSKMTPLILKYCLGWRHWFWRFANVLFHVRSPSTRAARDMKGNGWEMGSAISTYSMFHFQKVSRKCSVKKLLQKILQSSQESACARGSFNKVGSSKVLPLIVRKISSSSFSALFIKEKKKETLAEVFPFEFCHVFIKQLFWKNTSGGCFRTLFKWFPVISNKVLYFTWWKKNEEGAVTWCSLEFDSFKKPMPNVSA